MNSRERVQIALSGGQPDRVPKMDLFWEATIAEWYRQGLPQEVAPEDFFDLDIRMLSFDQTFGFEEEELERGPDYIVVRDGWGMVKKNWSDKRSTPQLLDFLIKDRSDWDRYKALVVPDSSRVNWDSIRRDYERFRAQERFVVIDVFDGYEATWTKVGPERLLVAMVTEPDWVGEMFETHTDFLIEMLDMLWDQGIKYDGIWVWGDIAYRNGLLYSPELYRKLLLPCHKRLCRHLSEKGIPAILHSCGRISEVIPDFIRAGFRCLQPLEAKAGLDVRELKQQYGRQISLMGNIDVRLMNGNRSELEREIERKLSCAKVGGGYIYHSDHSIPFTVRFEDYIYLMELIEQHGTY